ncbi:MAG: hypothetical protein QW837_07225 [Conexivisphaerales archaeon]
MEIQKRAIVGTISHKRKYLTDVQNAIRYAIEVALKWLYVITIGCLRQLY